MMYTKNCVKIFFSFIKKLEHIVWNVLAIMQCKKKQLIFLFFFFFFLFSCTDSYRNIFNKWSKRSWRCPWCRHSHYQCRRQPSQCRGEKRVFHLDAELESWSFTYQADCWRKLAIISQNSFLPSSAIFINSHTCYK